MPIQLQGVTHTYSPGSAFQATAIHDVTCTLNDFSYPVYSFCRKRLFCGYQYFHLCYKLDPRSSRG